MRKQEQEMDPVPFGWFLEGTGSINLQHCCCLLDFEGLLLFPNCPHYGFHHLSPCTTDRCDGINEFAKRIFGRYCMLVHREGRRGDGSSRSCQHAHEGFIKRGLASISPIGSASVARGELPRFFESRIVNNFLVIARIAEGIKC